ncbi:MAG: ABC transporter permease [Acidimicrobiales bacterium]
MIPSELRSGAGYWIASLRAMLRFDYGRMREWAAMLVLIQTMMGAGMALLYGFFYPHITPFRALYITTGAPTLALIPLGFVMLPGSVGQQKIEGTFDYIWALPAPRSAQATSTFLLYALLALPGTVLALLVAAWRYGVHLSPSPLLLPAVLLCALMAIAVGYGMALAISDPLVTNLVTNALMFVVLLFSPIVYPPSQLPGWLFAIHRVLPFYNMAVAIRAGLTTGVETQVMTSFLVLAAWTVAGCSAIAWTVTRRR